MARAAASDSVRLDPRQTSGHMLGVLAGALMMVALHPAVGLPVAAFGLTGMAYGRRSALAFVAAAIGGVLGGLLGRATVYTIVVPLVSVAPTLSTAIVYAGVTTASLLVAGPVAAAALKRRGAVEAVVIVVLGLSVVQYLALAVLAASAGQAIGEFVGAAVAAMAAQMASVAEMQEAIVEAWPGLMVAMNMFAAVLVVAVASRSASRRGVPVRGVPALVTFDLDPRFAVLPIAAIALIAAGRLPIEAAPSLAAAGTNLLIVARWVFFVQGIAVFAGLYERAGLSRGVRRMGYVVLGITEALLPLVSLTGLADVWLNVRRLPRDGARPGVVEAPSGRD